ncbi:hypothetical protein ACP4OV_009058 [Aristida adscensionis]
MAMPPRAAGSAAPTATACSFPAAVVCNAFVQRYFRILCVSPDLIRCFYTSRSFPAGAGVDLEAIAERVREMDPGMVAIETVRWEESQGGGGGITVLVTGSVTCRRDGRSRGFAQSSFLAPQAAEDGVGGYIVRDDTFCYIDVPSTSPAA